MSSEPESISQLAAPQIPSEGGVPATRKPLREEDQIDLLGAAPPAKNKGGRPRRLDKPVRSKDGPPILKALRKETGLGVKLLAKVEKQYPGDPLLQVDEFFEQFVIPAATGRKRTVSIKTELLYVVQMRVFVKDLQRLNMRLQNLSELSARHVRALTDLYVKDEHSASSLAKKNTVLRRFGIWIGKPDMAPRLADLVANPHAYQRCYSAKVSKAWSAMNIDPQVLIQRMDLLCPVAGLHLRLQLLFGLRPREAVMLKPFSADQGKLLFVLDGTKGGRARALPIDTPQKRDLIERAKVVASGNARRILSAKPSMQMQRAMRRYYYLAEKVGITMDELGITLHGLRHHFANEVYREVTGVDSPVNGGAVLDPALAAKGADAVSELLGHSRRSVSSAYIGNHRTLGRVRAKNMRDLLATLEGTQEVLEAIRLSSVGQWWVIGPAANGEPVGSMLQLVYQAPFKSGQDQASADMQAAPAVWPVALAAGAALGCHCLAVSESSLQGQDVERLEVVGWSRLFASPSAAQRTQLTHTSLPVMQTIPGSAP